jgi:protein TonB
MFEDSLVESSGRLAARHPWTTFVSFLMQSTILMALLLASLIYTETLPNQRWMYVLEAPPPPPTAPAPPHTVVASVSRAAAMQNAFTVPTEIPIHIAMIHDADAAHPPQIGTSPNGVVGALPVDGASRVTQILRTTEPPTPRLNVQRVRVSSGVAQGLLIRQVNPVYPPLAKTARVEGRVILQATIGKDGTVENLHLISGHPMLAPAAIDAVRQWRYKPYYLNSEPIEVETTITVNFTLTP